MVEFVPLFRILGMLVLEVIPGGVNAVVEPLALHVIEFLGRFFPSSFHASGGWLASAFFGLVLWRCAVSQEGGGRQCKSKHGQGESSELHGRVPQCNKCTLAKWSWDHSGFVS